MVTGDEQTTRKRRSRGKEEEGGRRKDEGGRVREDEMHNDEDGWSFVIGCLVLRHSWPRDYSLRRRLTSRGVFCTTYQARHFS